MDGHLLYTNVNLRWRLFRCARGIGRGREGWAGVRFVVKVCCMGKVGSVGVVGANIR